MERDKHEEKDKEMDRDKYEEEHKDEEDRDYEDETVRGKSLSICFILLRNTDFN